MRTFKENVQDKQLNCNSHRLAKTFQFMDNLAHKPQIFFNTPRQDFKQLQNSLLSNINDNGDINKK